MSSLIAAVTSFGFLLTDHLSFLAWIADLITAIFGSEFLQLILGLPVFKHQRVMRPADWLR